MLDSLGLFWMKLFLSIRLRLVVGGGVLGFWVLVLKRCVRWVGLLWIDLWLIGEVVMVIGLCCRCN